MFCTRPGRSRSNLWPLMVTAGAIHQNVPIRRARAPGTGHSGAVTPTPAIHGSRPAFSPATDASAPARPRCVRRRSSICSVAAPHLPRHLAPQPTVQVHRRRAAQRPTRDVSALPDGLRGHAGQRRDDAVLGRRVFLVDRTQEPASLLRRVLRRSSPAAVKTTPFLDAPQILDSAPGTHPDLSSCPMNVDVLCAHAEREPRPRDDAARAGRPVSAASKSLVAVDADIGCGRAAL